MTISVGVLAGCLWRWRGPWVAVGLNFAIEILQLVTARGLCESDDVMHNMIGAAIGFGIVVTLQVVIKKIEEVLK